MTNDEMIIRKAVRERYGRLAVAEQDDGCCGSKGGCCGETAIDISLDELFSDLYTTDTSWLPADVTGLSLGCGDPIALAGLELGQVVLDLGSGGGIDCFMAARQVGPDGRVIGVDMTPEMLAKANRNKAQVGLENVEFRQGLIENMPVEDYSVDVIISNCVINLSPDKAAVFHEAYRVLRAGGRLAVSDMMTVGRFGPGERADLSAWAGCVTGAEDVSVYVAAMRAAGFGEISIVDKAEPAVELAGIEAESGPARLFSARVTAVKSKGV
jgi:arsenite methyltransferase